MLKGLFGFGKGSNDKAKSAGQSLSPAVRDAIVGVVGQRAIPVMPGAAQKAFALASNPKAEAQDFIEVIEVDEALAARVIKIANSVFFDRGKKSSSIEEAVLVIGLNELKNLLNANALSDIFPSSNAARTQLWAHDIACALVAKQLAGRFLPSNQDSAFLAGLMHDVGKLLLLQRSTESYEKVLRSVEQEGIDFREAEGRVFPFDHCEVGHLIAERWNFSEELIEVIRGHHESKLRETATAPALIDIVFAADTIVNSLGLGLSAKYSRLRMQFQERLPSLWQHLNVSSSDAASILDGAKRNFETEYDLYSGNFGK